MEKTTVKEGTTPLLFKKQKNKNNYRTDIHGKSITKSIPCEDDVALKGDTEG